jgi:hypothetical protein
LFGGASSSCGCPKSQELLLGWGCLLPLSKLQRGASLRKVLGPLGDPKKDPGAQTRACSNPDEISPSPTSPEPTESSDEKRKVLALWDHPVPSSGSSPLSSFFVVFIVLKKNVYIYIYIYIYIHIYIHTYIYVYVCMYMYIYTYTYIYVYM